MLAAGDSEWTPDDDDKAVKKSARQAARRARDEGTGTGDWFTSSEQQKK